MSTVNATQVIVYDDDGVYDAWCSFCSTGIDDRFKVAQHSGTNYCPRCGARNIWRYNLDWREGNELLYVSNVYDETGRWLETFDEGVQQ